MTLRIFRFCFLLSLLTATQVTSFAQNVFFTTLATFNGTNGSSPYDGLARGADGNFYGTTYAGGDSHSCWQGGSCGTVFKMTPGGTLTSLYSFNGPDGAFPVAGLVQASDGNFYGTTQWGGTPASCENYGLPGCGTIFRITPSGVLTMLYSFCSHAGCADGFRPTAALVEGSDGKLYGTTSEGGGSTNCPYGCGTVFRITSSGVLTTLHSFNESDGDGPGGTLIQATDGNFYGTTGAGGARPFGTIFKMTSEGVLTTLYNFDGTHGEDPEAGLVQAADGNFYGTTYYGGMYGSSGTVFRITAAGDLTTLYDFCSQQNCTDGVNPAAALVQATDGSFYGTTVLGGAYHSDCYGGGCGTVFKITAAGDFSILHSFNGTDGYDPYGALVQGRDGSLYGTTEGGSTVFRLGAVQSCTRCRQ